MLAIIATGPAQLAWNLTGLQLAESSTQPRARQWLTSLHNNDGWSYFDEGAYTTALAWFERALALRQAQGKPAEIRVAQWCVARTLRALGRTAEALAIQMALATANAADGRTDGFVYQEIGECLLACGRAEEAATYFAQARTLLA